MLTISEERLLPVRGLVTAHSASGARWRAPDLERWLRLNRVAFKAEKIDVLDNAPDPRALAGLSAAAAAMEARISLRTEASLPPTDPGLLRAAKLLDIFLCPPRASVPWRAWMKAARAADLPVRLQLAPRFEEDTEPGALAAEIAEGGAVAVNLALSDAFAAAASPGEASLSEALLARMNALGAALRDREIEVNLLGVPLCLVEEQLRPHAANIRGFFLDHQQYDAEAYALAVKLYARPPAMGGKAVLMLLGRETAYPNPVDDKLIPWLLDHPWVRARLWAWHKLTRHLRLWPGTPRVRTDGPACSAKTELAAHPECGRCALRRLCDGETPAFRQALPGVHVTAVAGEPVTSALHFAARHPKYYDAIDTARRERFAIDEALAAEAEAVMRSRPPDREIGAFEYEAEHGWHGRMPGLVQWRSFTNTEKLSTPLGRFTPPFTLAVTVGGGTAEYVGFALGREGRLVCPMTAYAHRLALHAAKDGRCILLRDGQPVRPVEFAGRFYAPRRVGDIAEPRISLWNIDGLVTTQSLLVWEKGMPAAIRAPARVSIVIICTRYARRLEAALRGIAHQRGVPLSGVEVVVGYAPGLDATEDVLDSLRMTYSELRVVRVPFARERANAKGLMINECVAMASGEWVILLDADVLLPPDFLARLDRLDPSAHFVAPDGRKMLPADVTARILMGEIEPWKSWEALLNGPGELRQREGYGVPIGFCQVVRRRCFDTVRYLELEHFEGADHRFALDMREHFGPEVWLSGAPVLHLDHGGSHWYGALKHL